MPADELQAGRLVSILATAILSHAVKVRVLRWLRRVAIGKHDGLCRVDSNPLGVGICMQV